MRKKSYLLLLLMCFFIELPAQDNKDNWEQLFNGKNLAGWKKLNGEADLKVEEGVISSYLCHIANIALRVGRPLETDPSNGTIYDREAMKLWGREYEPGWEPNV